jgi:hypothetical protein
MAVQKASSKIIEVFQQINRILPSKDPEEIVKVFEDNLIQCTIDTVLGLDFPPVLSNFERKKLALQRARQRKVMKHQTDANLKADAEKRKIKFVQNILNSLLHQRESNANDFNFSYETTPLNSSQIRNISVLGFQKSNHSTHKIRLRESNYQDETLNLSLINSGYNNSKFDLEQFKLADIPHQDSMEGFDLVTSITRNETRFFIPDLEIDDEFEDLISIEEISKKYENYSPQPLHKSGKSKFSMTHFIGKISVKEKIDSVKEHN